MHRLWTQNGRIPHTPNIWPRIHKILASYAKFWASYTQHLGLLYQVLGLIDPRSWLHIPKIWKLRYRAPRALLPKRLGEIHLRALEVTAQEYWRAEIGGFYTIYYYTMLCYAMLYYTVLYYTILYYTILYYTILYYPSPEFGILTFGSSQGSGEFKNARQRSQSRKSSTGSLPCGAVCDQSTMCVCACACVCVCVCVFVCVWV